MYLTTILTTLFIELTLIGAILEKPIKLIIDTDGVHDDLRALTIALKTPNVEVIGITTVHGGVSANQAIANVARLLRALDVKNIPIFLGSSDSIIPKGPVIVWETMFGFDGIGGVPDAWPKSVKSDKNATNATNAVDAIIDLSKVHDDVVMVCIGPLTNLAKASLKDKTLVDRLKKVIVMGGNYLGIGNSLTNSTAEFNFLMDPEAAQIVLSTFFTTIVPWDTCFLKGPEYSKIVDYEESLNQNTPISNFLRDITTRVRNYNAENNQPYSFIDDIAVAIAIDGRIAKKVQKLYADVELGKDSIARGQVTIDWLSTGYNTKTEQFEAPSLKNENNWLRHEFVTEYDVQAVNKLLLQAVRGSQGFLQ